MPIESRTLESVQSSAAGTVLVVFLGVDQDNREWRRGRIRFIDENAAQTALDVLDWDPELENHEENEAVDHVIAGGDPNTFTLVNLTLPQLRTHLLRHFRRVRFHDEGRFLCNVSDFIANIALPIIANLLGIPLPQAQDIIDRAVRIRDVLCPEVVIDDGTVVAEEVL